MSPASTFRICDHDIRVVMRLEGRGSMRESPAFCEFVGRVLHERAAARMTLDLTHCENLDSTFIGGLATLHREFSVGDNARFHLTCSSTVGQRLFGAMGLQNFFAYEEPGEEGDLEFELLEITCAEAEAVGRHALECHRRLVDLGGPRRVLNAAIVRELERDFERRGV